jgi:hypothetical protein
MKDVIEAIPKWIAAGSVALLILAVTHEYGYFAIIGPHLQTVISPYDYAVNALVWLPSTLMAVLLLFAYMTMIERPKNGRPTISKFQWLWQLSGALGALAFAFFAGGFPVAIMLLSALGMLWLLLKILPERLAEHWQLYKLIMIAPAMLIFAYGYGVVVAYRDLDKTEDVYLILQKGRDASPRSRVMLRGFDKGILVRDYINQRVEFMRWDDIVVISKFATSGDKRSLSCKWLGIACFGQEPRWP